MLRSPLWIALFALLPLSACAGKIPSTILNLNVFDQLQSAPDQPWPIEFRINRMTALSNWIRQEKPDLVVFQEAQAHNPNSVDSMDIVLIRDLYRYRWYVHEMTGADGRSYGYWFGAKTKPVQEWSDGFFFPGGVDRKTQAALWKDGDTCLGVLSLHMSYQSSEVRVQEAAWVLAWIEAHKVDCANWVVLGDFNADEENPEIQALMTGGLHSLVSEKKPTIGAFNPIRQIYGKDIPSRTIDWSFGTAPVTGVGRVVFDTPVSDLWLSDHAGIYLQLDPAPAP